jgi:magnesium-transporting ATPase (P-type)
MKALSRFFIFIGITLVILIAYVIPFQEMGVDSDFFGVLQDVRLTTSWHSFWQGCLAQTYYSLNEIRAGTHFLSFYRPIAQHLHLIESYFFGNWWYGYTLGAITFFGMTAGILGVIFSYFYAPLDAIILALLWATHPALSPSLLSVTVLLSSA